MTSKSAKLIATLGSKPQLITLAVDCLTQSGENLDEVIVVHTRHNRPETQVALMRLSADFPKAFPHIPLRFFELTKNGVALQDVTSPDEVDVTFRALYALVRAIKMQDQAIHLLIAGGRRTLTVFGMAVAQMLFDDRDHLWHLSSHPVLEDSGRLHAEKEEWTRLIPIPVIPWGRLSPVFDALREVDDPFEASQRLQQLRLREQWDLARIFALTKISPAELAVIELLARDGLNQNEIAERLTLSPRTVEQHLRAVYRKAAEHWELADVNQTQLVHLLGLYFSYKP
jgi:CRISPR-associated protein Csx14